MTGSDTKMARITRAIFVLAARLRLAEDACGFHTSALFKFETRHWHRRARSVSTHEPRVVACATFSRALRAGLTIVVGV